ncbi:MAG: hypothetical protein JSU90_03250, partial [Nitrospiraceae bacterium]
MDKLAHYFVSLTVTGITHFLLAIFVYTRNRAAKLNQIYALYSLSIAVWSIFEALAITRYDRSLALLLWRINHVGVIFLTVTFVHFVFEFLNIEGRKKKLIPYFYAVAVLFTICNATPLFIRDVVPKFSFRFFIEPGPLYYVFFPLWVLLAVLGLYELHRALTGSRLTHYRKNQMKYFYGSMLVAYMGGMPNFLPTFGIEIPFIMPFATYAVAGYAFITAYAITRYHLMDINVVFRRTMVYSLSAGLLTTLFIILVLVITHLFSA